MGMEAMGIIGFVFGLAALHKVVKLEGILKQKGVIDSDPVSKE